MQLDFGDLTKLRRICWRCLSNSVKGLIGGGMNPAGRINTLEYITIASQEMQQILEI